MHEADNLNPNRVKLAQRILVGAILFAFALIAWPTALIHLETKLAAQALDNQEMQIAQAAR